MGSKKRKQIETQKVLDVSHLKSDDLKSNYVADFVERDVNIRKFSGSSGFPYETDIQGFKPKFGCKTIVADI